VPARDDYISSASGLTRHEADVRSVRLLALSVPLVAHHGNASTGNRTVVQKGVVTEEWLWPNPHTFLKYDVKDEKGPRGRSRRATR
jgi:hypothetical protein